MDAAYKKQPRESIVKWPCLLWHDEAARVSVFALEAEDLDLGPGIPTLKGKVPKLYEQAEGTHH